MTALRKKKFHDAVAKAARENVFRKPSGRPVPENLTSQGRTKGLHAMRRAKRCNARRRDGCACKAPALRGAKRCVKHGGRVEVPEHPHNIRRFLSGEMYRSEQRHNAYLRDRKKFEELPYTKRRAILSVLPKSIIQGTSIYRAAVLYNELQKTSYKNRQRIWNAFLIELDAVE